MSAPQTDPADGRVTPSFSLNPAPAPQAGRVTTPAARRAAFESEPGVFQGGDFNMAWAAEQVATARAAYRAAKARTDRTKAQPKSRAHQRAMMRLQDAKHALVFVENMAARIETQEGT